MLISSDCRLLIADSLVFSSKSAHVISRHLRLRNIHRHNNNRQILLFKRVIFHYNEKNIDIDQSDWLPDFSNYFNIVQPMSFVHQRTHLHWHSIVKLLYGLVVDGDGHLRVSVEGELYIVAGPVLPCRLITRQLQVLTAPRTGRGQKRKG